MSHSVGGTMNGGEVTTVECPNIIPGEPNGEPCEAEIEVERTAGGLWVLPVECPYCKVKFAERPEIDQAVKKIAANIFDSYDPSPWCSYGHMSRKECDCGPIARND
ncbi:MAG: hypothetical protein JWL61_5019 [Gemmatimonadetes bacterium]|nr:hypothetical protein [Gemmatimonadota bacterium]